LLQAPFSAEVSPVKDKAATDGPPPLTPSRDTAGPAAPAAPPLMGVYQLLDRLGQGGMGTVWRAWHTRLKRTVALKTLRAEWMGNALAVVRFQREMEAVGKLDHPNLIRATDAGEAAGVHFLVMDFAEGTDAAKVVLRHGPLPIADACEVVRQAALGLQHAHEAGLVHRDVKPSNLMVTPQGQVKVLDLGLALLHGAPDEVGELTGSHQGMGTADYMAPEQCASAHDVDVRADVYSLGCTLYKLLSGRAPFSGPEYRAPLKKMEAHAREPAPPLRDRRPEVPAGLVGVLDRMLAKDPAARFATPGAVAAALAPFAAGCDLPALVAGAAPAVSPPGAETVSLGPPTHQSAQGSPVPPIIHRPTAWRRRLWWTGTIAVGVGLIAALLAWWSRHTGQPDPSGLLPSGPRPTAEPDPTGVWINLLDRPPEPLLWPAAEVPPRFENDRQRLLVSCEGHGLLRLGVAPPHTAYKLLIGLRQPQWTGGVGLFFGYPDGQGAAEPVTFQQLLLMPPARPNGRCRLYRSIGTLSPDQLVRPTLEDLYSEEVGKLGAQEYILEIEVAKNGFLEAVRWDGKTMAVLARSVDPGPRAPPGGHGVFGIAVVKGSAVLTTARWLMYDKD
jgi:serine/threonine protein kinase